MNKNSFFNLTFAATMMLFTPMMGSGSPAAVDAVEKTPEKMSISWVEYDSHIRTMAKKIHESGWDFDQIVCIARGGMFVGDPLSRIFQKPLAIISASSYREEGGTRQDQLIISDRIAMTTRTLGKKILLVDDLVDSGVTLREVKKAIAEQYPDIEEIRTAVLWRKTGTKFEADYYSGEVESGIWILQPFDLYEDVRPESL